MKFKYKTILNNNKIFLKRFSFYNKNGSSYKLHLILNDDLDEPHTHPWDFTSLILFGGYYEGNTLYKIGSINKKLHNESYKIRLRRLFGFRITTITISKYSKKLQLCSFCKDLGYCQSNKL